MKLEMNREREIFNLLVNGSFAYFIASSSGFFGVIYLIYALAESKNKKLNIVDSTNFAIMLLFFFFL